MPTYSITTQASDDSLGLTFILAKTNERRANNNANRHDGDPEILPWTKLEFLQNAIDSAMRGWQKEAQRAEFVAADIEAKFANSTPADKTAVKLQLKNASGSNKGASGT